MKDISKILRNRAFDLMELDVWCARNSEYLVKVHDSYYYRRQLEALLTPDLRYYETIDEWVAESENQWKQDLARVKLSYHFN